MSAKSQVIDESQYSWLRKTFWPIYGAEENKKFIPLLLMMMLGLFNYTCLRINKDDFILGALYAGKDTLSFLKVYFVMPATILFLAAFFWASNRLSKEKLLFATLMPFFIFFFIFTFFLRPYNMYFHATPETIKGWVNACPRLRQLFPIFGYWTYSMFYVVTELWGNVVITFLFWGFANEIVRKDQTKRFYSLFASYGNFGLIIAGRFTGFIEAKANMFAKNSPEYLAITSWAFYVMLFCIFMFAAVYWHLNNNVLPYETIGSISESMKKKPSSKASIMESLKVIASSKYLLCILILVLAYGITANLVEATWKEHVKHVKGNNYKAFMANFFEYTGWTVFIFGFLSKGFVSRFGWLFTAIFTPVMMLLTSTMFFSYVIFGNMLPTWMAFGFEPALLAVWIGAIQNIGSKATKYTLFDTTTQMAYLPLEEDKRLKGKAAVDVVGGRAGKAGGALIQSTLSMIVYSSTSILFVLVSILTTAWMFATVGLSVQYNALLKQRDDEEKKKNVGEEKNVK